MVDLFMVEMIGLPANSVVSEFSESDWLGVKLFRCDIIQVTDMRGVT